MGKVLWLAFLGVCVYVVMIHNEGALFLQFVDAVAPWLTEKMLEPTRQ